MVPARPLFKCLSGESKDLAVMDMWKPFRNTTRERAPQAAVRAGLAIQVEEPA